MKVKPGGKVSGSWQKEHRMKMEYLLGRPLAPGENVHHVNGDRSDNSIDGPLINYRSGNLELWSTWQPKGQRVSDKIEYALALLGEYGGLAGD